MLGVASARAARWLAALWALTSLVYLLHPQAAIPLFRNIFLSGPEGRLASAIAGIAACAALFAFPRQRPLLLLAAAASAAAMISWHSWLGAYQPLVPPAFLFLYMFGEEPSQAPRALLDSLYCALLAGALHRCNLLYLSGFEFGPEGSLAKDFPGWLRDQSWFRDHPAFWARAWLISGLLPLPFLVGKNTQQRLGWILLALAAALTILFYKVLFYGFFLVAPAYLLWNGSAFRTWRRGWRLPAPSVFYASGMVLFFLWYLEFRGNNFLYATSLALCLVSAAGGEPGVRQETSPFLSEWSIKRRLWLGAWLLFLLLPLVIPSIPPPFGLTHFSAREARFPPTANVVNPEGISDCGILARQYAFRWGYRWKQTAEQECTLFFYR